MRTFVRICGVVIKVSVRTIAIAAPFAFLWSAWIFYTHGPFKYAYEYEETVIVYTASQLWFPSLVISLIAFVVWKMKKD